MIISHYLPVVYDQFLTPQGLLNDTTFLTRDFVDYMLRALGVSQGYAFSGLIKDMYFKPGQLGNVETMFMGWHRRKSVR